MESVHSVDVSWMTQRPSKDNQPKYNSPRPHDSQPLQSIPPVPVEQATPPVAENGNATPALAESAPAPIPPKSAPPRPGLKGGPGTSPSPPRRPSWLSSISSKFSSLSSSPTVHTTSTPPPSSPQVPSLEPIPEPAVPQGPQAPKNVMLPHGAKSSGDEPYTPAPVKSGQGGFLQSALRRLSSSTASTHSTTTKGAQHGLCQRMVLNVDHHRERCQIAELNQAKLRRVAFCVDVEIASGPRYDDDSIDLPEPEKAAKDKKKYSEKGEGAALKHPEAFQEGKPEGAAPPAVPANGATEMKNGPQVIEKDTTKKKEKKKRSEEERKARKEKKRKQAEENGAIPVEVVRDVSNKSDSSGSPGTRTPKTQASPTTDPVRIYRRCCQLRETPILKKITEQLGASVTAGGTPGLVNKLDLTGYGLHLPDLVTLGDYLAVVPVKELILENCGLTDEGARVILAGLLAAKPIDSPSRRPGHHEKDGEVIQGGVVERVVLKDNPKIGRDGWRHICLFINMCRSLKSLDVSKIPFPQALTPTASQGQAPNAHVPNAQAPNAQTSNAHTPNTHSPGIHPPHFHAPNFHVHGHNSHNTQAPNGQAPNGQPPNGHLVRSTSSSSVNMELSHILSKAVGDRLAGDKFELFVLAGCGFTSEQLGDLVDGFIKSGLRRLGLAGNNISPEGMTHIARYIREGNCEGLDLGGNDLKDQMGTIVDALQEPCELYALSLADCNLTPDSLWTLFPALAKLKNFRFIDLSQNHDLFETNPSAITLLRRYLPKMPVLRRIHLSDVSMTPEQAIALAEILPDTPSLAHVNIMENPKLVALASAKGEANQEEACALYASLMAAVRVSRTIICIDIEVPSNGSSEVVKALAKQVVAYCLWNMERGPVAEISDTMLGASETNGTEKGVAVPDVLLHLVGHAEDAPDIHDDEEPAPDDDYVIGGTGVVKALGICLLNRGNDARRTYSGHSSPGRPSTPTDAVRGGKAKQMSKNLLGSARRIRARLQPALLKEASSGLQYNYQRLLFLDNTLKGMIKRFEDEFPETRLQSDEAEQLRVGTGPQISPSGSLDLTSTADDQRSDNEQAIVDGNGSDDEVVVRPVLSRHNSDVSIASKALSQEEGRMHRFGQKFRRDIINAPEAETSNDDNEEHVRFLRAMIDDIGGQELQLQMQEGGHEKVLQELNNEASALRTQLINSDPDGWKKFVESQEAAEKNAARHDGANSGSAIE